MSNTKTQKQELVKALVELNLDGINEEFLNTLDTTDLQTLFDSQKTLKNEKTKTVRSNVAINTLNSLLEGDATTIGKKELNNMVRGFNLDNYFTLPDNYEYVSFARVNADAILNRIQSNKDTMTNSERLTAWLDRSQPYINSHLVGKTIKGNLFQNKDSEHYFTYNASTKTYSIVAKVEEAPAK